MGGAIAGFGFYKLFSTFCSSNDSLVDDACKELMETKQFTEQLVLLENEFHGITNIEKRQLLLSINENLARELINTSPNKLIDHNYISCLRKNIKNLKFYQTKLPKRMRKLEKDRDKKNINQ